MKPSLEIFENRQEVFHNVFYYQTIEYAVDHFDSFSDQPIYDEYEDNSQEHIFASVHREFYNRNPEYENYASNSCSEGDEEAVQSQKKLIQHDVPSLKIGESIFLLQSLFPWNLQRNFVVKMILLLVLMDCFK